jgi:hypothetical protein
MAVACRVTAVGPEAATTASPVLTTGAQTAGAQTEAASCATVAVCVATAARIRPAGPIGVSTMCVGRAAMRTAIAALRVTSAAMAGAWDGRAPAPSAVALPSARRASACRRQVSATQGCAVVSVAQATRPAAPAVAASCCRGRSGADRIPTVISDRASSIKVLRTWASATESSVGELLDVQL